MINQAYINGTRVDVITYSDYMKNPNLYNPKDTFIQFLDDYIYPIRTSSYVPGSPGIYLTPGTYGPGGSPFLPMVQPVGEMRSVYSSDNVVDYKNVTSIIDFLNANSELAAQERKAFLSDTDDIVKLNIDSMYDSPLMVMCKTIINNKGISAKMLENRMGANYNNNMRLLKNKNDISYNKAVEIMDCIDVKLTCTATNSEEKGIINPLSSPVVCKLN